MEHLGVDVNNDELSSLSYTFKARACDKDTEQKVDSGQHAMSDTRNSHAERTSIQSASFAP